MLDAYRSIAGRGVKRNENKEDRLTILSEQAPKGRPRVPPRLRGTSAADVGCRLVRAGWYYSEPFVTRPTRQPLSFSRHPLARPLSRVFIAANRRNMPTRGLPRSFQEKQRERERTREGGLRGCDRLFFFFLLLLLLFPSSSFGRKPFGSVERIKRRLRRISPGQGSLPCLLSSNERGSDN